MAQSAHRGRMRISTRSTESRGRRGGMMMKMKQVGRTKEDRKPGKRMMTKTDGIIATCKEGTMGGRMTMMSKINEMTKGVKMKAIEVISCIIPIGFGGIWGWWGQVTVRRIAHGV